MSKLKRNSTIAGAILIAGPIIAILEILFSRKIYGIKIVAVVVLQLAVSIFLLYSSRQLSSDDRRSVKTFIFSCYVVVAYFLLFCTLMVVNNINALGFNFISLLSTAFVGTLVSLPFTNFINQARRYLSAEAV